VSRRRSGTLLLVAARQVKDPKSHCPGRGLDRAGVGKEGVVRGSTEAQRIFGATEPPDGFGVGCEVVGGHLLGIEHVELRGGGGPISCLRGPPRLRQCVAVLVHPMPSVRGPTFAPVRHTTSGSSYVQTFHWKGSGLIELATRGLLAAALLQLPRLGSWSTNQAPLSLHLRVPRT
jgi:hypothetical protein